MGRLNERIKREDQGFSLFGPDQQEQIDGISQKVDAISLGVKMLGSWNVSTNTPTLSSDASAVEQGGSYQVSVGGTSPFSGVDFNTSTVWAVGDRIVKQGSQWSRLPFAIQNKSVDFPTLTLGVSNRVRENELDAQRALTNVGTDRFSLTAPLSYTRYTTGGSGQETAPTFSQAQGYASSSVISITGYTDNPTFEQAGFLDTGIAWNTPFESLTLIAEIGVQKTNTNPGIGIGFGTFASPYSYVLRKNGQLVRISPGVISGAMVKDFGSGFAYTDGDIIGVSIYQKELNWEIMVIKNGVYSTPYILQSGFTPVAGTWLIGMRGSMDYIFHLEKYVGNPAVIQANAYSDQLPDDLSGFDFGQPTPTTGNGSSTNVTRIHGYPIVASGLLELTQLQIAVETGGIAYFSFWSRNSDGTFNFQKEYSYNFSAGVNTIDISGFSIQSGWYPGFRATNGVVFSGIVTSDSKDAFSLTSTATTGNNITMNASSYKLQFKLRISYVKTTKDLLSEMHSDVFTLKEEMSGVKYAGTANFLQSIPYSVAARSNAGTTITANVVQTLGVDGINISATTSATSDISLLTTDSSFIDSKLVTLVALIQSIGSGNPGIGIAVQDGTAYFLRDNGQVFSVGPTGTTTIFRNSGSGGFVVGNVVKMAFDFVNKTLKITVNDVDQAAISISIPATPSGNIRLAFRSTVSINNTMLVVGNDTIVLNIPNVIYVAKTGLDTNSGVFASPVLTIAKAIEKCIGRSYTMIVIMAGDYRETVPLAAITNERIFITNGSNEVVRILGSDALTGWTKTSGYTNIYQIAYAGSAPVWDKDPDPSKAKAIFEDKNQSIPISASERHPAQRGLSYRLPYTEIPQIVAGADLAATLTALDSAPGKYYLSGGVMYLHASGSTNPASNGFGYEIATRDINTYPAYSSGTTRGVLEMSGLQFLYCKRGFVSAGFSRVNRAVCSIHGAMSRGGWLDDFATQIDCQYCEAAGTGGDGWNPHYDLYISGVSGRDKRIGMKVGRYIGQWAHDNRDDGHSGHDRDVTYAQNGLYEYNGDCGIVPAQGSCSEVFGAMARGNGWASDKDFGFGFGAVNTAVDGRNGTNVVVRNCVSEGNSVGYGARDANNRITLIGCISRNNSDAELNAWNDAVVVSKNTMYTQSNPAKVKVTTHAGATSSGTITVDNDTLLT